MRISKHANSFGLYPLDNKDYPKTLEECEIIIHSFNNMHQENMITVVKTIVL